MIETFSSVQTSTVRSNVSIVFGDVTYPAFLVSTYVTTEDDSVDIKIAESLEFVLNNVWTYFYQNLQTQQWQAIDNSIVNVSISLAPSTANEGDVYVDTSRSLRTAVDSNGTPVYGVWQENSDAFGVQWFYMDNNSYTGPVETLTVNESEAINNSVNLWYADLRTSDNQWLLLYQVISTDASGNILQVIYVTENGRSFDTMGYDVQQNTVAFQTTEVYQSSTVVDESIEIDVNQWIGGREIVEMTLNIVTPFNRRGRGRSTLILGSTRQFLPMGRKGYFDRILPGHKIRTIPKVELANGSRLDCDLRFTTPARVVKVVG